jgi:hypothetical protein
MACQGARELHHVFRLAAGVRIAAQLKIRAADQAVHTDQQNIELVGLALCNHYGIAC